MRIFKNIARKSRCNKWVLRITKIDTHLRPLLIIKIIEYHKVKVNLYVSPLLYTKLYADWENTNLNDFKLQFDKLASLRACLLFKIGYMKIHFTLILFLLQSGVQQLNNLLFDCEVSIKFTTLSLVVCFLYLCWFLYNIDMGSE